MIAAFGSRLTFAIYVVGSERAGERLEPVTTLFWVFGFATVFWALATPWWSFPWDALGSLRNVLLGAGLIVAGKLVPFKRSFEPLPSQIVCALSRTALTAPLHKARLGCPAGWSYLP